MLMMGCDIRGLILRNKIIFLDEVDSTNDYAKLNLENIEHGTVINANIQKSGRGQFGRSWLSSERDLKISMVIKENINAKNIHHLSIIPAAAMIRLLGDFNIYSKIKWPNDVMVNERKIAGILVETSFMGNNINGVIVGVGLNICNDEKMDIKDIYISMEDLIYKIPDKTSLIQGFISYLNYYYGRIDEVVSICNRHSYLFNKEVKYKDKLVKVKNLDGKGNLYLEYNSTSFSVDVRKFSIQNLYKIV